jgi:pimeloyl-ACP methyl ester carboxylesterase
LLWILGVSIGFAGTYVPVSTQDGKHVYALVEKSPQEHEGRGARPWRRPQLGRLGGTRTTAGEVADDVDRPGPAGHGRSVEGTPVAQDSDYLAMVYDVEASVAWLRSNGVTEVSCVGASLGANLCLAAAARDPSIVNVVLLSPGLNYHGVKASMDGYGDRPVLFVASADDTYGAKTVGILEAKAMGQHHSEMYAHAGQGAKMLSAEASLEGTIRVVAPRDLRAGVG